MRRGLAILAGAALLVFSGVAITQPPDKDGPPKDKKKGKGFGFDPFAKAVKSLDLTDAQKPKVQEIQDAHTQKLREIRKKMEDALKQLRDDTMKDLKGVLTEKQMQSLEDSLKKGSGKKGDKKGPPPDDKKGEKQAAVPQLQQPRFAHISAFIDQNATLNRS